MRKLGIAIAATVAIVLVAIAAITLYGRGKTADPGASTPPPAAPSAPSSAQSQPPPQQSGGLPRGEAIAGGGGTTEGPTGLPLGYSHDESGAVNAATNMVTWINSTHTLDEDADKLATAVSATPQLEKEFIQIWDYLPETGATSESIMDWSAAAGAYAVHSYSDVEAVIWIFNRFTVEHPGQPKAVYWNIQEVKVRWVDDDWRLTEALGRGSEDIHVPSGGLSSDQKAAILRHDLAAAGGQLNRENTAAEDWQEYINA